MSDKELITSDEIVAEDFKSWGKAELARGYASRLNKCKRLNLEIERLRRGEFICKPCGLRKDADASGVPHDF